MRNTHLLGSLPIIASVAAAQDGILSFPVRATSVSGNLGKRQVASDARTRLDGTIYTIDVSIGTPGQVVSLEIDTGAEEMWVNPSCSRATYPALCAEAGRFTQSSTLYDLAVDGSRLADDGYVAWIYGYDTVSIGSTRIGEQIFGIASDSERYSVGQLGLGPSPAGWESSYAYVLDSLVGSRAISSKAFSLDLGRDGSEDGALIFGGIDTSRYTGALEKLPVVPASDSPDSYTRYWITGSRITVSRGTSPAVTVSNTPIIFHVNSASPLSALPGAAFTALLSAFPEATSAAQFPGRYTVPCTLADAPGSVDFTFGGAVISVPLADFVWRQPEACYLGAYSSETPVLGANFLRAAYVVFDWDNRELHVANSVRERGARCPSNLVAIGSGPGAVPSVVGSCQGSSSSTVSSTSTSSSSSSVSSSSTSSATSTVTSISTSSSVSSTLSTSTISSTSVSSTSTTSTLSLSVLTSSTSVSSTLSTSTLSSSAAASPTDTSSATVSSTESSTSASSTHTSSTADHTSTSSTTDVSSSATSDVSSTSSDDGRLGGRGTDYNSRTASLDSSTSSGDSSTISSSATSSAYDGFGTASSETTSTSSTISRGASSAYGASTTAAAYDDLACEAETPTSSSSTASLMYGAESSSSEAASSSETTDKAYEEKTASYSSSTASPTYGVESSSSVTSSSSESTEEPYQEKTYDLASPTASPAYDSEPSSAVPSSSAEEPYHEKTYGLESTSSSTASSSESTEGPYQEKTYDPIASTASPTYGSESSSLVTTSISESTEEPYHEKTYGVGSSSSTTTSCQSIENPYQEKTYDVTSPTASPTYGPESSSTLTSTSSQFTEESYEGKTDTSAISSTHVSGYGDKATQSAVPSKEPYQSDDYRDIPTLTTIHTTVSSASPYVDVTSSPADETTTITITATTTYTVTACPNHDSDCTIGGVTTEVITRLTTVCPDKTATFTTSASYVDNEETRLSTSTTTSSPVTDVPSKTCTESKDVSDTDYPAPTTSGSYDGMGHRGYGSGPQDDIYHEEEARGDDVPAEDLYHRGDVVVYDKDYHEGDASPESGGSHNIYGHDDFYEEDPKDGAYQPSPEPAYASGPSSSVQTPSPTAHNTPAYTSFVTSSAPSASSTGAEYEHVTAGASARGVPVLLIVCVGILTALLMQ